MDVFAIAGSEAFLRDAAVAAADELGVLARLPCTPAELARALGVARPHRLRALLDVLAAIGMVTRRGDRFERSSADAPALVAGARGGHRDAGALVVGGTGSNETNAAPRGSPLVAAGWGLLAEVIRSDRALLADTDPAMRRCHAHLVRAGADAARELAAQIRGASLLDLGGGAGVYTAAFLDANPNGRATLVDAEPVLAVAAEYLARFGDRVRLVPGDARHVAVEHHDVALLVNVVHLHPPEVCAELVVAAARVADTVVVKDLVVDDDRSGPLVGLMFALDMAVYTDGGTVYSCAEIREWLTTGGAAAIDEARLPAAPDSVVFVARTATAGIAAELRAALSRTGPGLELPAALVRVLARAIAIERADPSPAGEAALVRHYTETMPRMRLAQLAEPPELFRVELAWDRLPRLATAIDRLFGLLADAGVAAGPALGAETAAAFRARTHTLAELYARTHYGGAMPLLYGYPADLAFFARRARERGLDALATIDRYLTAPIVHELCHFGRDRRAIDPPHLDECIGGWLGVHVHPELAYPEPGEDDALYAAPWLAQVGQAVARAFGVAAVVRAYAGGESTLPGAFLAAAARLGWADWRARRTLHLLSDTLDPAPWVVLAIVEGARHAGSLADGSSAGGSLVAEGSLAIAAGGSHDTTPVVDGAVRVPPHVTTSDSLQAGSLAELASTPLYALALPLDPDFDRAILHDALRSMCLEDYQVDGSPRTRFAIPSTPIVVDARTCTVSCGQRRYWLPPTIAARMLARGDDRREVELASLAAIPAAVALVVGVATIPATTGM